MHGVLKCIVGNFHVTSYSAFSDNKDIPLPRSLANYRGAIPINSIHLTVLFVIFLNRTFRPPSTHSNKADSDLFGPYVVTVGSDPERQQLPRDSRGWPRVLGLPRHSQPSVPRDLGRGSARRKDQGLHLLSVGSNIYTIFHVFRVKNNPGLVEE